MENQHLINEKKYLIEQLTGIHSSKINYYLEVKKRNEEIIKQNNRLEIIHQIIKDINIDMSLGDIIERVYQRLPLVIHCDFLGLALMQHSDLSMTAMIPDCDCTGRPVPFKSLLWHTVRERQSKVYSFSKEERTAQDCPPINQLNLVSLALDPLIVKSNVIGVLMIGSQRENAYTEDEVKFTRQLADQLTICIENARLYEQVLHGKMEWEETFRSLTDPILLIDQNYNIIRCNNQLEGLPGQINGEPEKSKCYRYVWGRDEKCEFCLMDEVYQNQAPAYRRIQLESGKTFDVHYYPVFKPNREIYSVIHHTKDITEQIKMEAQLTQSDKLAAIGEMAAGVAHELNSPMTAIIGNSQMIMRDGGIDESNAELLQDIINCGLRCKRIIQNLLTFSRQDQRPMARTNLNKVVESVLSLVQYQINRNNVAIKLNLDTNLPDVLANEQQLDQVLVNLLLNARDALENSPRDKQITITTELRKTDAGEYVTVKVTDNGEGIPAEHIMKIFNPFFTSKEANRGTGLGLSVSLGIAEAHGGTIEVNSTPGQGSCFTLFIPVNC
ncbi:GAF domain-containing sensor histidine kinase [Desulfoscipio gibsoniae]|uniref:histidine kinase n=1 Tax=Desulfoscipio gibsoniae DSM 7213 TaxID=767817 RepID=R4KGT7_9FIRM|nr:ATP-binding protein [Desulfoscipio gibsoniae]AGL02413.1 histidine kinase [Desulfoscipio gibsoniae DSM 7213]